MNQEAPDIEMRDAADSTVAMTFYNLLAMTRGPMALEELRAAAIRLQHPHISEAQAKRAMDGLVTRGRAAPTSGGYTLLANEKLFVVQRDLGDYNPQAMTGGWEGWFVKDPRIRDGVGVRPIEQLLGQAPTGRKPRPYTGRALAEENST